MGEQQDQINRLGSAVEQIQQNFEPEEESEPSDMTEALNPTNIKKWATAALVGAIVGTLAGPPAGLAAVGAMLCVTSD